MEKAPSGIHGLDLLTRGGFPKGRATVVQGGPGCGKTVTALQSLLHGVREFQEPAIFVACEESVDRIRSNAQSFGWNLDDLTHDQLFFLDARPSPDTAFVGDFDFAGMLAVLSAKVESMQARRIAFDSIDFLLAFMPDPRSLRQEIYRLQQWLEARSVTALITLKRDDASGPATDFIQFMVDCALELRHEVDSSGTSHRTVRIKKYRGSSFEENATPFLIGPGGMEIAYSEADTAVELASTERVSTGVKDLDKMLEGGYFRRSSTLLSGAPGTAKTSLCGAFAEAASKRGEPTVFVGFDSRPDEVVRNLASIGVDLAPHLKSGVLQMAWFHAYMGNAEHQLMRIRRMAREHGAQNLIIDPLSALSRAGLERASVERLVSWARSKGLSMVCTSLLDRSVERIQSTPIEASTLADSWIHLSYHMHAGEHNRGLSIIKSRGTAHSNQVRELVLGRTGLRLADVYCSGGEVLMGTLRHERELELALSAEASAVRAEAERRQLKSELATLKAQLEVKLAQQEALELAIDQSAKKQNRLRQEVRQARGGYSEEA